MKAKDKQRNEVDVFRMETPGQKKYLGRQIKWDAGDYLILGPKGFMEILDPEDFQLRYRLTSRQG